MLPTGTATRRLPFLRRNRLRFGALNGWVVRVRNAIGPAVSSGKHGFPDLSYKAVSPPAMITIAGR